MDSQRAGQPVPRIPLPRHPAWLTLGDALRAAFAYWRATPAHWILPVVAVGLVNLLAELVLGGSVVDPEQLRKLLLAGASTADVDTSGLPKLIAGPAAVALVTIVAKWFLVGNAIAGLRGREAKAGWIALAGLRSLVADMLVAMIALLLLSLATMAGPVGILLFVLAIPAGIYIGIRLQLWTVAIFDGRSIVGGAETSWRLTRRAVLRVLGWGLALAGLGLLASVGLTILGLVLPPAPAVDAVLGGVVDTMLFAYTVIVTVLLYESQRMRAEMTALAGAGAPSATAVGVEAPAEPRGPFDPPPPPPPAAGPPPPSYPG